MTAFVRVAENGSLSCAARELMLSQPSLLCVLGGLEAGLGTTLRLRTFRSIPVGNADALYLDRTLRLLANRLDPAEVFAINLARLKPSAKVRVIVDHLEPALS